MEDKIDAVAYAVEESKQEENPEIDIHLTTLEVLCRLNVMRGALIAVNEKCIHEKEADLTIRGCEFLTMEAINDVRVLYEQAL